MRLDCSIHVVASSEQKAVSGGLTRAFELLVKRLCYWWSLILSSVHVKENANCKMQNATCNMQHAKA